MQISYHCAGVVVDELLLSELCRDGREAHTKASQKEGGERFTDRPLVIGKR